MAHPPQKHHPASQPTNQVGYFSSLPVDSH